jgi:iron complex outermembrane receptor protein
VAELSSNGAHEGTNRYEYGNVHLQSETSLQFDAGIEVNTAHISLNVTTFYNDINHFIFYRKLAAKAGGDSLVNVNGDMITAFKFSQSNAMLYGAEINFDIHPHPLDWLHFENSFSYVRGQFAESFEGSSNIPFIPAARLLSELRGNFKSLSKIFKNYYAKIELDNTFSQNSIFTAYHTETATNGYALLNAGMGGDVQHNGKTLCSIYISANNLTDVAYQNHMSRLKYTDVNHITGRQGVFNIGRNFALKVNVPLSFKLK